MTEFLFSNNAESTLAADIGGEDSTFSVASGDGALFPSVSAGSGKGFYVLVKEGSKSEWMLVTARSGDNFTVTRSDSNSFSAGASVIHALNATVLASFLQKGVFREVTSDPNGSLSANYQGEEVYNTTTEKWHKHCTGTVWKVMNGDN